MSNPNAFPTNIYFAFFVWLPLTMMSLLAIIVSPGLLIAGMIGLTSKTTTSVVAAVFCLSILPLQWSHHWIHQQDDLLDQLVLGPAD